MTEEPIPASHTNRMVRGSAARAGLAGAIGAGGATSPPARAYDGAATANETNAPTPMPASTGNSAPLGDMAISAKMRRRGRRQQPSVSSDKHRVGRQSPCDEGQNGERIHEHIREVDFMNPAEELDDDGPGRGALGRSLADRAYAVSNPNPGPGSLSSRKKIDLPACLASAIPMGRGRHG